MVYVIWNAEYTLSVFLQKHAVSHWGGAGWPGMASIEYLPITKKKLMDGTVVNGLELADVEGIPRLRIESTNALLAFGYGFGWVNGIWKFQYNMSVDAETVPQNFDRNIMFSAIIFVSRRELHFSQFVQGTRDYSESSCIGSR